MAQLAQVPPTASFSESPILVNTQTLSSDGIYNSSSLQHVLQLYVWKGNKADRPATASFTLRRFPVENSAGTYKASNFDLSTILSSYTTSSMVDLYDDSNNTNTFWFTYNVYDEAKSGSVYITGSNENFFAYPNVVTEGYVKWGENTSFTKTALELETGYPFLSALPVSASATPNLGTISNSVSRTDLPYYFSLQLLLDSGSWSPGLSTTIDNYLVEDELGNGYTQSITSSGDPQLTSSVMIREDHVPSQYVNNFYLSGSTYFSITARDSTNSTVGNSLRVYYDCLKKYTPVRIAFKNRYGQFDQFEFSLVSNSSFSVDTKMYKQNALNDVFSKYDTEKGDTTYYTDGKESITVNTDYIDEAYNELFKQMMISDEIYMIEPLTDDGELDMNATLTPLILQDKTLRLKKSEVDKLVQYTFTFSYGTPFKLTL